VPWRRSRRIEKKALKREAKATFQEVKGEVKETWREGMSTDVWESISYYHSGASIRRSLHFVYTNCIKLAYVLELIVLFVSEMVRRVVPVNSAQAAELTNWFCY
jgi:hypothetical protein